MQLRTSCSSSRYLSIQAVFLNELNEIFVIFVILQKRILLNSNVDIFQCLLLVTFSSKDIRQSLDCINVISVVLKVFLEILCAFLNVTELLIAQCEIIIWLGIIGI